MKKNPYISIFSKTGHIFSVKFSKHLKFNRPRKITLRWTKRASGEYYFHMPEKRFKSEIEVIYYLIENVEKNDLVFKVLPS